MNNITKISDITYQDLAEYLRLVEYEDESNTLNNMLSIAKNFISNYTGRTIEDLDNYNDLVSVIFVLVQDMYDNRSLYVDKSNLNNFVETTLGLHQINLLW
jgi:hypothetical protein